MARVIAVALPKGGVGKTTTSVNLAASLAVAEQRTLLIDLDTFGASALSLGFKESNTKAGIYEVFSFVAGLNNAIHKTELSFLDFVPSNTHSLQAEERLTRLSDNRAILKNCLRSVSQQYDYIILDCPPFLRGLTTNALIAADSVLMPVKSGHFSIDALEKLYSFLDWLKETANKSIEIEGILVTMHEGNTRITDLTVRELTTRHRKHMFETMIPKNSILSEASFFGKPAILYNVNSRGTIAYLALAKEIIARHSLRKGLPYKPGIFQKMTKQA